MFRFSQLFNKKYQLEYYRFVNETCWMSFDLYFSKILHMIFYILFWYFERLVLPIRLVFPRCSDNLATRVVWVALLIHITSFLEGFFVTGSRYISEEMKETWPARPIVQFPESELAVSKHICNQPTCQIKADRLAGAVWLTRDSQLDFVSVVYAYVVDAIILWML